MNMIPSQTDRDFIASMHSLDSYHRNKLRKHFTAVPLKSADFKTID